MKIHEYQAKEILKQYGVQVPEGGVALSVDEAVAIASKLGGRVVVKAQIHAGGRGKGGGVKLVSTVDEARAVAGEIFGMQLVTHQTGPEGKKVHKLLVEEACDIDREIYLGITLDRSSARLAVIGSPEGGVEIEKIAAEEPEKIFKFAIDPDVGLEASDASSLASSLGLNGPLSDKFVSFLSALYEAYVSSDASLAEINPLVVTKGGELLALDAKINLDDNALYRHEDLKAMMDPDEEDPAELEAKKFDLSYISLDGNIGCMVNGAGLAMATMDIIKLHGGEPANFLDVGGAATKENVSEAFKIILGDANVKAILVNIFGGIVKCDMIAEGITAAAQELDVKVPLVVRLQGTNVKEGRRIIGESDLNIVSGETLDDAAKKSVEVVK